MYRVVGLKNLEMSAKKIVSVDSMGRFAIPKVKNATAEKNFLLQIILTSVDIVSMNM